MKVGLLYRHCQILTLISNDCFQNILWPVFQLVGAILSITLLYPLLAWYEQIPQWIRAGLAVFSSTIFCEVCLILSFWRKPINRSAKLLQKMKTSYGDKECKRFFKSCQRISIAVGPFHKIDNSRAPAFIKFVLQRAIFLALKTKTSQINFENSITFWY